MSNRPLPIPGPGTTFLLMDAIALLKQDHRFVEDLFKKFEKAGDEAFKVKRKLVDQMIAALSTHAAIEEQLFYPTVRLLQKLEDDVLEAIEEHGVVKWILSELEKLAPEAERFDAKVAVLMDLVRHHVQEEEQELFPKVRKAIKPADLKTLGMALEKAKKLAPKRPHPRAPDAPPGNLVVGTVAGVLDRGVEMIQAALGRSHEPSPKRNQASR